MKAKPTLFYNAVQLIQSGFGCVIHFPRTSRSKAAGEYREDQRTESWIKVLIKGTVDEDVTR